MKSFIRWSFIPAVALLCMTSSQAFADSTSHKGHITLSEATQIANQTLAPGDYQMKWQQDGSTAQVSVVENGKVVATTTANVVTLKSKADNDEASTSKDAAGKVSLVEARFSGQNVALDFGAAK
jgi:hypothetical protein